MLRCIPSTIVRYFKPPPPTFLPQYDPYPLQRQQKIENSKKKYQLEQEKFGIKDIEDRAGEVSLVNVPPMLSNVPCEEKSPISYSIRVGLKSVGYEIYQRVLGRGHWTVDDMISHFRSSWILSEPKGCEVWRTENVNNVKQTPNQMAQADHWFAWQRMNGVTRNLIRITKDVPKQFAVIDNEVASSHPYLEKKALKDLQDLYVVDLSDVALDIKRLLCPIALFAVREGILMPIAIHAKFDGRDDEIFTPPPSGADHKLIQRWTKAKMWFNMLDAQYHESITHLGFTHLLMDGVSVCVHRNLSERHPVFKLLAPHFRHMHAINNLAASTLIDFGGYVDKDMYYGRRHMLKLIGKHNEKWHLNQQGSLKWDLDSRGVEDLPGYYFKDDAWKLHEAIRNYVEEYLTIYYKNDKAVKEDEEIQALRKELTAPRSLKGGGGCGMQGVPNFDSINNLATSLVSFIYICSVEHSATNFPQYDQYGFPPNYAAKLNGHPEEQHGEGQLDAGLPNGKEFFSTIKIMKILTTVLTNNLGNYEKEYMNALDKEAQSIVQKFQKNLRQITIDIEERNRQIQKQDTQNQWKVQSYPYSWLKPDQVLNSISI